MKGKGNCLIVACNKVIENKELLFCYAYVMGQGDLAGQRILHAWNELGDVVFDFSNGNKVITRKKYYYKAAKIKEKDVVRQDSEEIAKLLLEYGTYGGWIE